MVNGQHRASRSVPRSLLFGYAGVAGFLALEASSRADPAMAGQRQDDDGTTQGIVVAYVASAALAPVLASVPQRRLSLAAPMAGLILQGFGLLLRRSAMETLGTSYTRTIRTSAEQQLVVDGPYSVVRHPGYLASILIWIGFALTSRSPFALALVAALMARAYWRRILVEEGVLARDVPGYAAYRRRTFRLIPFVW